MAKFSYVNKEKQLVEFSFNDIKPENPINDFIQNNSVDDSYDFDELTTNGIYLFQNISKINNEVKHRPAALAGSGQLFFFSEEPSKANRIVFQLVFSDSDESKLHYRRGMANSAGLQFEEWQSTSRSTEAASNFAISKVSPASIVGGSWIKNSSVPASMVWEHSGVSTYVDGQTSGMNVLLNLETFALSASQEVYIKESGAFQKMTLGIGCGGTGSTTAEGARNALGAASQTDLNSLRDSVSSYEGLPQIFVALTASNNRLYFGIPAPPLAHGANISGTIKIDLRSSTDESVIFTPTSNKISGGICQLEGTITPSSHFSNTCFAGWISENNLTIEWIY